MSKYGNKKVVIDGIKFDSKMEAEYYLYLNKKAEVLTIELQPKFILQPSFKLEGKTIRAINYIADFKVTYKDGTIKIIDVKGMETADFKLKKKMFEFQYGRLHLITKSIKWGVDDWIELDELKKRRKGK